MEQATTTATPMGRWYLVMGRWYDSRLPAALGVLRMIGGIALGLVLCVVVPAIFWFPLYAAFVMLSGGK